MATSQQLAKKVLVIGGNGYVGSHICQAAVSAGWDVSSLNRSGKPERNVQPWMNQIQWHTGSVFERESCLSAMKNATAVVSTVGAFGSNETMERMNGDANIEATNFAVQSGVKKFIFISSNRVGSLQLPKWAPMYGYYHGKERAEASVRQQ